jgi:hypothetical protein
MKRYFPKSSSSTFGIIRGLMFFKHQVNMKGSRCWKAARCSHHNIHMRGISIFIFEVLWQFFSFSAHKRGRKKYSKRRRGQSWDCKIDSPPKVFLKTMSRRLYVDQATVALTMAMRPRISQCRLRVTFYSFFALRRSRGDRGNGAREISLKAFRTAMMPVC